ncbi:hypothetical protein BDZ91DRAFT_802623 [Kalaharituber pfeilii]|nr:hypothetical protein BDZ91DRAFT_802623 [Kalaharituber pfeilii]
MTRDEESIANAVNSHRRKVKKGRGSKGEKEVLLCALFGVECRFAPAEGFNNAAQVKEDAHRHLLLYQCDHCFKRYPKRHNLNRHSGHLNPCKRLKEGKELSVDQKSFLKKLNGAKGIEGIKKLVKAWKTLFAADEYLQKVNTRKRKSSEIPADSVSRPRKQILQVETYYGTLPSWVGSLNNAPYAYSPTQVDMSSTAAARNSTEYDHNGHQNWYMQMNSIMEQEQSGNFTPPLVQYTRADQFSNMEQEESGNFTPPLMQYTHPDQFSIMEQEESGNFTPPLMQYSHPDQVSIVEQEESGNFTPLLMQYINPSQLSTSSEAVGDTFASSFVQEGNMIAMSSPQMHLIGEQNEMYFLPAGSLESIISTHEGLHYYGPETMVRI